jgi:hypothetical protein
MKQRGVASFRVDRLGTLLRRVDLPDGRFYEHACLKATFDAVVDVFEMDPAPATVHGLAQRLQLPLSQTHVAVEFLAEFTLIARARVGKQGRGPWIKQSPCLTEEALASYHYLKETGATA